MQGLTVRDQLETSVPQTLRSNNLKHELQEQLYQLRKEQKLPCNRKIINFKFSLKLSISHPLDIHGMWYTDIWISTSHPLNIFWTSNLISNFYIWLEKTAAKNKLFQLLYVPNELLFRAVSGIKRKCHSFPWVLVHELRLKYVRWVRHYMSFIIASFKIKALNKYANLALLSLSYLNSAQKSIFKFKIEGNSVYSQYAHGSNLINSTYTSQTTRNSKDMEDFRDL